jgi:hypothetical protein
MVIENPIIIVMVWDSPLKKLPNFGPRKGNNKNDIPNNPK